MKLKKMVVCCLALIMLFTPILPCGSTDSCSPHVAPIMLLTGCSKNPIKIKSVRSLKVKYSIPDSGNDYCEVQVDFPSGTISVHRFTETTTYTTSGSDEMPIADTHMQEESQTFPGMDVSALESFLVANSNKLLPSQEQAYDYSGNVDDIPAPVYVMDILSMDYKMYHSESLEEFPAGFEELRELLITTSGTTLKI